MVIHNTYSADRTTAVCQDWGFSGISVFLLHLRSAENTRFQKSPTSASAKTLCAICAEITQKEIIRKYVFVFAEKFQSRSVKV